MAITIIKQPTGIYPAYNNSFIEFSSDLADNNRAEITASPPEIFPNTFLIYPDGSGKYVFNIKEVAKTILNVNGFEDSNFFDDSFFKNISGLYLLQEITIEVFSDIDSESTVEEYQFYKSVKQIGVEIFANPFQILSNSENGVDFYLTYFEGFPFHFDLQRVTTGKILTVKNLNTLIVSPDMATTATSAFRMNVDRSNGENWTADNFLPLIEGLNRLEILEDGVFKTNLFLKKKRICNGIYLKWFNEDSGFGHFLFQKFYTEEIKGKDIAFIGSGQFLNVGELNSEIKSTGRNAIRAFKIKVKYDHNEARQLKTLFTSPMIQLYSSTTENIKGEFINVGIKGNYSTKTKVSNNELVISVVLPEMITAKL